jgi:hypothetical protein
MKSVEELEREADRCRVQFETKVDQIRHRLMPQRLADEALRAISLPGTAATDAVVDTAKRNPLLVLALAAGAGWFLVTNRQKLLSGSKRTRRNHKRMKEIGYVNSRR